MKWWSTRNGVGEKKQTRIGARETRDSGQKMIREPQQRTRKRNEFHRPVKSESKNKYESSENINQAEQISQTIRSTVPSRAAMARVDKNQRPTKQNDGDQKSMKQLSDHLAEPLPQQRKTHRQRLRWDFKNHGDKEKKHQIPKPIYFRLDA